MLSERGRRLDSAVVETNGRALVKFLRGVPGNKHLCLEEGTQRAWLYEVLRGQVNELVVTHAYERKRGPKDDQRDAFHLTNSLRLGAASPVYKDGGQLSELRAHADVYAKLVTDVVRAQNRLKALFRSRGVQVVGGAVYTQRDRQAYLDQLARPYQSSALILYSELDALRAIKKEAEKQLLAQSQLQPTPQKHLQRSGHHGHHPAPGADGQRLPTSFSARHQAPHGQAHLGPKDWGHRVGHVEEQGGLPPRALPTDTLAAACTGKDEQTASAEGGRLHRPSVQRVSRESIY